MIKNIIFDIGNVLAGFVWQDFYRGFGFSSEVLRKLSAATVESPLWHEMDQGNKGIEEMIRSFQESDPSIHNEIAAVFQNLKGIIAKYDYARPWLEDIKARGYHLYIISNISEQVIRDCRDAIDFLDLADGVILSYQEKMQKPDPAIYRLLLERFCLQAEDCIFLDDQEKNIQAAALTGIQGILFRNYPQASQELEDILAG